MLIRRECVITQVLDKLGVPSVPCDPRNGSGGGYGREECGISVGSVARDSCDSEVTTAPSPMALHAARAWGYGEDDRRR